MVAKTLYDKLWDAHLVRSDDDGTGLLYIDRHLVHEVTSPQAFEGLRLAGRKPWRTASVLAVPDHNVPTTDRVQGIADPQAAMGNPGADPAAELLPGLRVDDVADELTAAVDLHFHPMPSVSFCSSTTRPRSKRVRAQPVVVSIHR